VIAGTVSLSTETNGLIVKDVVNSSLLAVRQSKGLKGSGFKTVIIMGDHTQDQDTLKRVAAELDLDWKPRGVRVYWVDVPISGKTLMRDHLTGLDKTISPSRMVAIDDAAELMVVDRQQKWVRREAIPKEDLDFVTPQLGKIFIDLK